MADIKDPENTLVIETTKGKVVIAMRPDLAPKHVERIKKLVRERFYDGIVFHRVIDGLHGPDRLPQGHRHGRVEAMTTCRPNSAPSRTCAACAPWRALAAPTAPTASSSSCFDDAGFLDKQVHRLGQGHRGHGQRRQDQARRAGAEPRQDDQRQGRRRRGLISAEQSRRRCRSPRWVWPFWRSSRGR